MTVTITKDTVEAALKSIRDLTKKECLVGIPAEHAARDLADDHGGTINNAAIGYIAEMGSPARNIPARPHLVPGIESIKDRITKELRDGGEKAISGDKDAADKALHSVGLLAVAAVKGKITSILSPALSPKTLYNRRHRKEQPNDRTSPLMDTFDYIKHITYVVQKKGDK